MPAHGWLFGEDQGRYLVATAPEETEAMIWHAAEAGLPCLRIGTTGGDALVLGGEAVPLATLRRAHEDWLPGYMG